MNNGMIKFSEEAPKRAPWVTIGSGFPAKNGKGFNIYIGNKVRKVQGDPKSDLVETVEEINLKADDQLYLAEATDQQGNTIKTKAGATVYRLRLKPREENE